MVIAWLLVPVFPKLCGANQNGAENIENVQHKNY
jgi:hypothetical protein